MEPNNKVENQFRDKLNNREINPSPMAWDRLDAMLTVAENKKSKQKWNWLFIAAGFVGILFGGLIMVYQSQSAEIEKINSVVVKDTKNGSNNNDQKINQIKNNIQISIQKKAIVETNKSIIKNFRTNSYKNQLLNKENQYIISNQSIINHKTKINENENQSQLTEVNQKTEAIQKATINVNPETLLSQIESSKIQKLEILPQQVKVNANSLLSEVDGEVTQEFRETKLSKLKRNFQSVKSALVSRNDK